MSTNLKVTAFKSDTLTYKIVSDTTLTAAVNTDVTTGSGVLHSFDVDNQHPGDTTYLKISLTAANPVVGTTVPDVQIRVGPQLKISVIIPGGVAFTKLSFWQVDSPTTAGTTASGSPVIVSMVTT
jgi:hypothetical protein